MPIRMSVLLKFHTKSKHRNQGFLKTRNDSHYRTVPKHRSRNILPMRAGRKQNRFVPVKTFLNATIRLRRSSACAVLQVRGHDVRRVPELTCAVVRDSCERAATRRPPVRWKDRLPNNKHPYVLVAVLRQQLLRCGGPPQTSRSSWRQQQDQARNTSLGIERLLKLPGISF